MRVFLTFFFAGMTSIATAATHSLIELQHLDSKSTLASVGKMQESLPENSTMKLSAMRDAALATGAQHGYSNRMEELKTEVRIQSDALDNLYDFSSLMRTTSTGETELYLLPPVITAAANVTATDAAQRRIRISNELFVITEQARMVTRPPNWREYLVFDDPRPISMPNKMLLPETQDEQRYWAAWVAEGWKAGIVQADLEMASRVRKLANTYTGMIRYARMNLEEKVVAPNVSELKQNVTGDDNEMRVDDRVYELTLDARMNTDPTTWRAIPTDSRDSLLTPDEAQAIDAQAAADREAALAAVAEPVIETPPESNARRESIGDEEEEYLTIFGKK